MSRWIVLIALSFVVPSAVGHVPTFNEAGATAETAFVLDDPTKSWVFYDELQHDEQHWFRFEMAAGTVLHASLHLPPDQVGRPALWVVGPTLEGPGPEGTPAGFGGIRVPAQDELSVEPFSPLAMRATAQWREPVPATGTYYLVIEAREAVVYSVGIGARESFTPVEWLGIPVERIAIQQWGGVPWVFAIIGETLGVIAGMILGRRLALSAKATVGIAGAGAVAGTSVTTLTLATIAAWRGGVSPALIVPALFSLIALGLGYGAFRTIRTGGPWWAGLGWAAGALAAWAGLLIGPALLVAWSLWEQRRPGAPAPSEPQARETMT